MRQLTLSTDKDKYGIRLRAEPDHMVLGKRLKGAFKSVTASIKELKSEQLEAFQKSGEWALVWPPSGPLRPLWAPGRRQGIRLLAVCVLYKCAV